MKIKIQMLDFFRKSGLLAQIYIICYLLIMFSGSTIIKNQVSNLLVLLDACLIIMAVDRRFGYFSFYNKKNRIPFLIIFLFVIFLVWQMVFIAYVPSIVWTYIKRYCFFAILLVFLPQIDLAVCAVKWSKYYAFIVACSIIMYTMISGQKSGGLVGDYQAAGMMMSISCILFMIDYFNDIKEKRNLFGILISVSALFMSGKRMFALIAVFAFLLIYCLSEKKNKHVRFLGAIILLAVGILILYMAIPTVRELFMRVTSLSGNETTITSGRNVLWEKAMEIFGKNKIYGIGFGAFQTYFSEHYNIPGIQAFLTHNIYYGLLAETGIIGFTLFVFFMIYMLKISIKIGKDIKNICDYKMKYLWTYSVLMQIWFIAYGFTGNGIYDTNESFFYFSAVAIMLSINVNFQQIYD